MTGFVGQPDTLPRELADALATSRPTLGVFGDKVLYFATIGSTNDVAMRLALAGEAEGLVVVADAQTAGRGRRGRQWFSPAGAGLYISLLVDPSRARNPDRATALLTIAAGVALAEAIEASTGLAPDIKWPNDLHVAKRKLAGILAEGVTASSRRGVSRVILGYGINVAPMRYPPELAVRATSLERELGRAVDRSTLAVATIAAIARRYADLLDDSFDAMLDAWRRRAPASRGANITWQTADGARTAGTTAGIDERGALLVQTARGMERIVSGEVQWV